MLLKLMAALSAAATGVTLKTTELSKKGKKLLWLTPALAAGYFAAANITYILGVLAATELFIDPDKPNDREHKLWDWTLEELSVWLCTWARVKVHVTGLEKLPEGRFLMVCNHRSLFDPATMMHTFKDWDLVYISKPSNFRIPVGGKLMHAYGCLPLDRDNNREALKTIKQAAGMIKNDEASVCIYPEGTRGKTSELLPFHAGSFKIAQKAAVPVVAVTVYGTDRVEKNFPFKRSDVYIDVTEVIDADFVRSHKTAEVAELTRDAIQKQYTEFERKEKTEC